MYKFLLSISLITICIISDCQPYEGFLLSRLRPDCGQQHPGVWQWCEAAALENAPTGRGPGQILIEDNDLYLNNLTGLRIRGTQPVTIRKSRIHSNGGAGIILEKQADVTAVECTFFDNSAAGINIDEASRMIIKNSRVYSNMLGGVRILGKSGEEPPVLEVKIIDSRIYLNDMSGIRSMPPVEKKVDLTVTGSVIHHNKEAGIRVENATHLTAKDNRIYENGRTGIFSYFSAIPPVLDIYRNRVSFNQGAGIHIIDGITGAKGIRNNWIYNNHRSGIMFGFLDQSTGKLINAKIINNTIVSNGGGGEGGGIRNESLGKVEIMNNIIAYNYNAGIITKHCRGYSFNLYYANGDSGNCCDDPYRAPFWVERTQISGCMYRGKGDLITDPLFVNPDKYDFRLQDKSPALGAGYISSPDGDISSTGHDIGATSEVPDL
jgi:hypothetical protein